MTNRGIVLSLLSALVLVMFGPAGPAPAAVAFHGVTTTHADRMPLATEPWRQLVEARLHVETTFDTWTATARLGDAIPATETVEVTWMAGRETEKGCAAFATFVEEFSSASEDHTVTTLRRTFDPDETIDPADATSICFRVSMRAGGIVSDALVGDMTADDAASAIIGADASATEHQKGYPKTAEAWQRLESASFRGDAVSGDVRLSASVGGPVPPGASFTVGWILGRQNPNGCEPLLTFAETDETLDPVDNVISSERHWDDSDLLNDLASEYSCFEVGLFSGDVVGPLDVLVGQVTPMVADVTVEAAPAVEEIVVAAGRSTPVIVTASSRVGARKGLTVVGRGPGVRAPRTSTGAVEARRLRPVVVRVAAATPGRSRLALTARDKRFDVARSTSRWPVVARRIEAQRPRPGRYAARNGAVRFRVTRDFVVRGLTVEDVRCEGATARQDVRLDRKVRLPRSGAAARVVPTPDLGSGFLGAQLLTTSPTRILGTFTVATRGCEGSVRFAAVRRR